MLLTITSCKKEKSYVYDVNNVSVKQNSGSKTTLKNQQEFISIAYSDLFGTTISQAELVKLNNAYVSFGDSKMIEDMIIRNYLKDPSVKIPGKQQMQANVGKFVNDTYKKLLNRDANEYEQWFMTNILSADTTITPELLYYSIMTSNEYRYY